MLQEVNSWTYIFLIAAAQGLFLSILIGKLKKGIKYANHLLATLIGLFSLSLFYYVGYWTGYDKTLPNVFKIILNFVWLFGPLHYLYLLALHGEKFTKRQLWHYFPFVAIIIMQTLVYTAIGRDGNQLWGLTRSQINTLFIVMQLLHLSIYGFLIAKTISTKINADKTKNYGWSRLLLYCYLGYCLSYLSYYVLVWTNHLAVEHDYAISLMMSIFIYIIGYYGFLKPEVLIGNVPQEKYTKSSLSQSASKALLQKLLNHMQQAKPFIDSELKLGDLAQQVGITPHHLSQLINENRNQNFSDFINYHRINHAKTLIKTQGNNGEKLINIAYDSGFNNKVSFNSAFKKFTGCSPSHYRNKIVKEKSINFSKSR